MSSRRRPLTLLVLAITSVVLAACSQTTAPRRDDFDPNADTTAICRGGYVGSSGRTC